MPQVNFYHLTKTPLEKAMPRLLERAYESTKHTLVLAHDEEQASVFNQLLWTYSTLTFIPHGTKDDRFPEKQPIYITPDEDNRNRSEIIFFHGATSPQSLDGFSRALYMFDGNDEHQISFARDLWKRYKQSGYEISYWKQNEQGGWEQQQ